MNDLLINKWTTSFKKFPESGPIDIPNYTEFLNVSKSIFDARWNVAITYNETLDNFVIKKLVGYGSFGSVVLAKYTKNQKQYAMKIILKEKMALSQQIEYLRNEKKVLQCTNFPFLVSLQCSFQDSKCIYLVMSYIPYEFFDLLADVKKLREGDARFYISQVVLAIEYLHYLDLIYRDLKLENILLDATGYIKLTDFGFCKRMMGKRTYTLCGTPEYMAPEVLGNRGYGQSVDWWSCGVLMYELVAGSTPFHGQTAMRTCSRVLSGHYRIPGHFSSELKDLVENILTSDLTKRYGNLKHGANEIKEHKWFKTVNWMTILNRTASVPFPPPLPARTKEFELEKLDILRLSELNSGTNTYGNLFNDF